MINEKLLTEFVSSKGGLGNMSRDDWVEHDDLQKADRVGKEEKKKEALREWNIRATAMQAEARLKKADEREAEKEARWAAQQEAEKEARWEAQQEAEIESINAAEESETEKNDSVQEPHWIYRVIRWCVIVYGSMGIFFMFAVNFPKIGTFLILLFWLKVLSVGGSDHSINSNGQ